MRFSKLPAIILAAAVTASCGLYRKFDADSAPSVTLDDQVGEVALPSWRDFFSDPLLTDLIDTALVHNADLAIARVRMNQAQANFALSRDAYIPDLSLEADGLYARGGGLSVNGTASLEWRIGAPGYLFARIHQAEARMFQAEDSGNELKSVLISQVAAAYYRLMMLDEKIAVFRQTDSEWTRSLNTQKALLETGKVLYNSVAQMESMLLDVRDDILKAEAEIADLERTICLLCDMPYRHISRSASAASAAIPVICSGVPMDNLRNRPDVRAAYRDLEAAYYLTAEARSRLFPSITISASTGWPYYLYSALEALQPVLQIVKIRKEIRISELEEEAARLQYTHTLLNASSEVYKALCDFKLANDKCAIYERQIEIQDRAYTSVNALAGNGKAGYLDIIKASEKLLDAKTDLCEARYSMNASLIDLYRALGGGSHSN